MPVQNIECQIAQAQISRLLANEPLNKEILSDLESHVATCADCQVFIMDKRSSEGDAVVETPKRSKKATKQAVVSDEPRNRFDSVFSPKLPRRAIVAPTEPEEETVEEIVPKAKPAPKKEKAPAPAKPAKTAQKAQNTNVSNFWKPLTYSGALALVLFGMSYLLKNPTALFGDKAMTSLPAATNPAKSQAQTPGNSSETSEEARSLDENASISAPDEESSIEPMERPGSPSMVPSDDQDVLGESESATEPAPAISTPVVEETPKTTHQPTTTLPKPKATPSKKVVANHPARPQAKKPSKRVKRIRGGGSVKFYDPNGQIINR